MKHKKKVIVVLSSILLISVAFLLNTDIINSPQIIVYVNGDAREVNDIEYNKVMKQIDDIFDGDVGTTKSEFDREEETRSKNYKSIEIIYSYPKLRIFKMEDEEFIGRINLFSKILIPLDNDDSSYELFTCTKEYMSGGLGFDMTNFGYLFD